MQPHQGQSEIDWKEYSSIPVETTLTEVLGIHVLRRSKAGHDTKLKIEAGRHLLVCGQSWCDISYKKGGGGSIDLVCYFRGCQPIDAVKELAAWKDGITPEQWSRVRVEANQAANVEKKPAEPYQPLPPDESLIRPMMGYLIKGRGVDADVLRECMARGDVYPIFYQIKKDGKPTNFHKKNIRFVIRSLDGENKGQEIASLVREFGEGSYNKQGKFYPAGKLASGPKLDGAFMVNRPRNVHTVKIAEAALDAMSLYELEGKPADGFLYASSGGEGVPEKLILAAKSKEARIEICYDSDEAGINLARRVGLYCQEHEVPFLINLCHYGDHKDFNSALMEKKGIERQLPYLPKGVTPVDGPLAEIRKNDVMDVSEPQLAEIGD